MSNNIQHKEEALLILFQHRTIKKMQGIRLAKEKQIKMFSAYCAHDRKLVRPSVRSCRLQTDSLRKAQEQHFAIY